MLICSRSLRSLRSPLTRACDIDCKMLILYNCNCEKCKLKRYLYQSQSAVMRQFLNNSEFYIFWVFIISELSQENPYNF